jgi:hypothetical protein
MSEHAAKDATDDRAGDVRLCGLDDLLALDPAALLGRAHDRRAHSRSEPRTAFSSGRHRYS